MEQRNAPFGGSAPVAWAYSRACSFFLPFVGEHDDEARGLFDAHRGVVDKHGVGGAHQWGHFAFAVAAIAFAHLIENFGEREGFAFFLMFFPAALCAHVGRSV